MIFFFIISRQVSSNFCPLIKTRVETFCLFSLSVLWCCLSLFSSSHLAFWTPFWVTSHWPDTWNQHIPGQIMPECPWQIFVNGFMHFHCACTLFLVALFSCSYFFVVRGFVWQVQLILPVDLSRVIALQNQVCLYSSICVYCWSAFARHADYAVDVLWVRVYARACLVFLICGSVLAATYWSCCFRSPVAYRDLTWARGTWVHWVVARVREN